jgi:hypothetical protein
VRGLGEAHVQYMLWLLASILFRCIEALGQVAFFLLAIGEGCTGFSVLAKAFQRNPAHCKAKRSACEVPRRENIPLSEQCKGPSAVHVRCQGGRTFLFESNARAQEVCMCQGGENVCLAEQCKRPSAVFAIQEGENI